VNYRRDEQAASRLVESIREQGAEAIADGAVIDVSGGR
jgi:hypothetical protein